jgi:hypothetical protein
MRKNVLFLFFVCILASIFSFLVFFTGIICLPLFGGRKVVDLPVKLTSLLNKIIFGFTKFENQTLERKPSDFLGFHEFY